MPPARVRYLAEIGESNDAYARFVEEQATLARRLYRMRGAIEELRGAGEDGDDAFTPGALEAGNGDSEEVRSWIQRYNDLEARLDYRTRELLGEWPALVARYNAPVYEFKVRDRVLEQPLYRESLSHLKIPRVSLPKFHDWGELVRWRMHENLPGFFPYAAGVFPLKRQGEDPARMFAGEGGHAGVLSHGIDAGV